MKIISKILLFIMIFELFLLSGCGYFELSTDEEITLGEQVAMEVESYYDLYRDPEQCTRVNKIVETLNPFTTRPFVYRVKIIDSDEINAFALPGGYIYIYKGLIDMGLNDDQLAGVIGHEITHIEAMHIAEMYERMKKKELFYTIAVLATGGAAYQPIQILNYLDAYIIEPKYSRENEMECDLSSVQMLIQSKRDPHQFAELFRMWEKEKLGSNWMPSWMKSHPDFVTRIRYIEEEISLQNSLLAGINLYPVDFSYRSYYRTSSEEEVLEEEEEVNLKDYFDCELEDGILKVSLTDECSKKVSHIECYGLSKKQRAISNGRVYEMPYSLSLDRGENIKYVIASIKYDDGEFVWDVLRI